MAASAGALFTAAGALVLAAHALGGDGRGSAIVVIGVTSLVIGCALLLGGYRLPASAFHGLAAVGATLIGVIVGLDDGQGSISYGSLYTLVTVFAFYWFPPKPALAHLGIVSLSCGLGLAARDGDQSVVGDFVLYFGTAATTGVVVGWLVRQAHVAARIDPLTGLANRHAWETTLRREAARSKRDGSPLCVVITDLDDFKSVNDEDGHLAGDALLRDAAAAWSIAVRPVDELARWGGDEFALVLPGCDVPEAAAIISRLKAVTPGGQGFSAGIARWSEEETLDHLVSRADAALYVAKRSGKRCVIVAP
jgi:diguanylate cyclase (GGDEF)-like protein